MEKQHYSVILFPSSSYALRAEKILHKSGIECKMMPVPRHLSSDCGICIRVSRDDRIRTGMVLEYNQLLVVGAYDLE